MIFLSHTFLLSFSFPGSHTIHPPPPPFLRHTPHFPWKSLLSPSILVLFLDSPSYKKRSQMVEFGIMKQRRTVKLLMMFFMFTFPWGFHSRAPRISSRLSCVLGLVCHLGWCSCSFLCRSDRFGCYLMCCFWIRTIFGSNSSSSLCLVDNGAGGGSCGVVHRRRIVLWCTSGGGTWFHCWLN